MSDEPNVQVTIAVSVRLSMWDALKLRVAGPEIRNLYAAVTERFRVVRGDK